VCLNPARCRRVARGRGEGVRRRTKAVASEISPCLQQAIASFYPASPCDASLSAEVREHAAARRFLLRRITNGCASVRRKNLFVATRSAMSAKRWEVDSRPLTRSRLGRCENDHVSGRVPSGRRCALRPSLQGFPVSGVRGALGAARGAAGQTSTLTLRRMCNPWRGGQGRGDGGPFSCAQRELKNQY
jgi:hypothetical protein